MGKKKVLVSNLYSPKHPQEWSECDLTRFFTYLEYLIMNVFLEPEMFAYFCNDEENKKLFKLW